MQKNAGLALFSATHTRQTREKRVTGTGEDQHHHHHHHPKLFAPEMQSIPSIFFLFSSSSSSLLPVNPSIYLSPKVNWFCYIAPRSRVTKHHSQFTGRMEKKVESGFFCFPNSIPLNFIFTTSSFLLRVCVNTHPSSICMWEWVETS